MFAKNATHWLIPLSALKFQLSCCAYQGEVMSPCGVLGCIDPNNIPFSHAQSQQLRLLNTFYDVELGTKTCKVPGNLQDKIGIIYTVLSNAGSCAPFAIPTPGGLPSPTPAMEDKESSTYSRQERAYDCHVGAPYAESV